MTAGLTAAIAWSQRAASPVEFILQAPQSAVSAGKVATLALRATIEPGWHLYSLTQPKGGPIATRIAVPAGQAAELVLPIRAPAPDTIPDPAFGILSEVYSDSVAIPLRVRILPKAPNGRQAISVVLTYQVCSRRLCLAPRTDSVSAALFVDR